MRHRLVMKTRTNGASFLIREISWSCNLVIIEKCKDDLGQEFYIRMSCKYGWTKNVLIHQIKNQTYEKMSLNRTIFSWTLPKEAHNQKI
jgi:predicted nuclease of restriction endonuclease-like (RecB) superfamily